MSIFISIASYCDPHLRFTIESALTRARWPDQLHFGVVDQSPFVMQLRQMPNLPAERLRVLHIDPLQSRGACWARSVAMGLYAGEDWFFQIDSHMDFDVDWDAMLIDQAQALSQKYPQLPGLVISSYPHILKFEDGAGIRVRSTDKILAHIVIAESNFGEDGALGFGFKADILDHDEPVRGFHIAGGCLFAPGHFVEHFPYDPYLYFGGEEQSLAARLFTHGWDIFHTPGLPVYHLYGSHANTGAPRPLHWNETLDAQRPTRWWSLEERSKQRLQDLLYERKDLGAFGLGRQRSLADYAAFCGIDYPQRQIAPQARVAQVR